MHVAAPVTPAAAIRGYSGSASVGDFLSIALDPNNQTISYKNLSNGDSGTVPYTIQEDGTYAISDPTGNLISAYEVPDYALILEAKKVGPDHNTMALVTAAASTPISIASGLNQSFNYMQFRTSQGGVEVGSAGMDSQGNITISSYWPFGAYYQSRPFQSGMYPASSIQQDPSGDFLTVTDVSGGVSYIFGTADGFIADRPDGAFLGFQKAASKDFDPSFFGTYKTSVYQKLGASSSSGTSESGVSSFDNGSVTIGSDGAVIITNSQNQVLAKGTLTPVADDTEIYDSNNGFLSIKDPCFGLFTFRVTTPTGQQDIFVAFEGRSVLLASFKVALPQDSSKPYDYFYGVGIK
jgi:hypothetical protein